MLFTLVSGKTNVNLFAHQHRLTSVPRNRTQDKSFQEKNQTMILQLVWKQCCQIHEIHLKKSKSRISKY